MMPRGVTLIEVIITLSLLSMIASVTTLAVRRVTPPDPNDPMAMIADSTPMVMLRGKPMTLVFAINGQPAAATIHPDGSVVADTLLHIVRLTGRSTDVR